MASIQSPRGLLVLMVAHVAGMIDLVALPVWVGTLMAHHGLDAQRAGALVTLFLVGVVAASLWFGPRFGRLPARLLAPVGYAVAAAAFSALAFVTHFEAIAALHAIAGVAAGCGLSFVHGMFGRCANPHRVWAIAGLSLGVFAILFFGGAPVLVQRFGGPALFLVFASLMALAAFVLALGFPTSRSAVAASRACASDEAPAPASDVAATGAALPRAVWWAIVGVVCMAITQSMLFSFVERIGVARGFGAERVIGVLVVVGFVNLTPAVLAAVLQHRLPAKGVAVAGPIAQALVAMTVTHATTFAPYAVAVSLSVFVMIFAHTFVFGLIAGADTSGRAVALTPATLMTGSALGPVLGGTLAVHHGFESLGYAAVAIATIGALSFLRFGVALRARPQAGVASSMPAA